MKRKNKLPRYWLGTRMPTSTGYLQSYAPTNTYTSDPGYDISPQTNAIKNSTIPNALSRMTAYGSNIGNILSNTIKTPYTIGTAAASTAANASLQTFGKSATAALGGSQAMPGVVLNTINNVNLIGAKGAGSALSGGKLALNAAGKGLAIAGSLYGLTDMGFQLASNQDHRSAGDMRNTLTTNTYTTDLGNKYTQLSGVNRGAELRYANAQKLNRNLNFTTTAIGTGASIGSLFTPGVGTAIGAGVGALVGLGANLFGFGDTEDETKKQIDTLTDVVSNENRMNRSLALDKDAKQGFYSRNGAMGAAEGKSPKNKKPIKSKDAMVSSGEEVGTYDKNTGEIYNLFTVPGIPNNDDTVLLKGGNKPNTVVFTRLFGIADQARNGDPQGALLRQTAYLKMGILKEYGKNRAKCGKLPKYSMGSPSAWDYALLAVPNALSLAGAYTLYLYDRNQPVNRPTKRVDYSDAENELYRTLLDLIDSRPHMNDIDEKISQGLYDIKRNPIYGPGGRAAMELAAIIGGAKAKSDARLAIDERNMQKRDSVHQGMANIKLHSEDVNNENWYRNYEAWRHNVAAKDARIAQDRINMINPIAQAAKDYFSRRDYQDALGIKERMIKLYENQQEFDRQWMDHWLNGGSESKSIKPEETANFKYKLQTPEFKIPGVNTMNGYLSRLVLLNTPRLTVPDVSKYFKFGDNLDNFSKFYTNPYYRGPKFKEQPSVYTVENFMRPWLFGK